MMIMIMIMIMIEGEQGKFKQCLIVAYGSVNRFYHLEKNDSKI